jgi:hypothetical protein
MSKGEISKEQALRLIAYTAMLTKLSGTLAHTSVMINIPEVQRPLLYPQL